MIPTRLANIRTVKDDLSGQWLRNCAPNLGEAALADLFLLWHMIANITLDYTREDVLVWGWMKDGCFSSKSAYDAFFAGRTRAPASEQIWKSRAPYGYKFFAWLASKNRCWMADRLERWGLPHPPACSLCDQEPETLQHLLLGCVVARQVWAWVLQFWGKQDWLPAVDTDLVEWWNSRHCPSAHRKDLWMNLILVFWYLWHHQNDVVFN
jgi:hypothetical protein